MRTSAGIRADCCGQIELRDPLTQDKRPPVDSRDRFFDFVIPPEDRHPLDPKRPHPGKFKGIASESEPGKLAQLHCCPDHSRRVQNAFRKKDPELLPDGPLKVIMRQVKTKYGLKALMRMN